MIVVTTKQELREVINNFRKSTSYQEKVSFVPTMGALHKGHVRLIEEAKKLAKFVVVSIFVNPTQFGKNEDFSVYPRQEAQDQQMCQNAGVDCLYMPSITEMYSTPSKISFKMPKLTNVLCGKTRKNHFSGVMLVVNKLFNQVQPDIAVFGLKDYQQFRVISQMVKDLDVNIEIIGIPTVREESGLAMSSRNKNLTPSELLIAPNLKKAMDYVIDKYNKNEILDFKSAQLAFQQYLSIYIKDFKLEYFEIVSPETLKRVNAISNNDVVLIAGKLGKVRLIDNLSIN